MGQLKDAIKRECRKQGKTQIELAESLGMKAGNFNNQISRDDVVQLGLVKKICEELSVNINTLVDGKIPDNSSKLQHSKESRIDFPYEQLRIILNEADNDIVEQILGKIGHEHYRVVKKRKTNIP
jgi:transcriptional regulator with XRE-family HTH domain